MSLRKTVADFLINALIAGIAIALVSGPLGSFIVWRRMSYFGDTLAHSALLGISLGILMDLDLQLAIITSCIFFAIILVLLQKKKILATDTLLGILAHSTLAIGILILSLSSSVQIDLMSYLIGDLLTISRSSLIWVLTITSLVAATLFFFWNKLLTITVHQELAEIEGVPVEKFTYLLVIMIALVIAVAMKIIGVLLITSLLIIPPAAARRLATTPEQMALGASVIGSLSVVAGLMMSFSSWDTPAGPSIVVAACSFFLLFYLFPAPRKR